MSSIVVSGDTSGAVTLTAPAVAGTVTVTLPSASGTMASLASVTSNGVAYVNSSGQPTSSSALVFDGTNLRVGTTSSLSVADKLTVVGGNFAVQRTSGITTFMGDNTADGYAGTATNHAFALLTNSTERARIDSSGNLLVGGTTAFGLLTVARSTPSSYNYASNAVSNQPDHMGFFNGGTNTGSITRNGGSGVLYNTTSDYRLKNITGPITGAKDFIMALQPKQGTWKVDGSKFVGFLAHEFQEVSPSSVVGEKDAVDADGKPIMQAMQASSSEVMANLIALVQEQQALITQLQADVAALKGA